MYLSNVQLHYFKDTKPFPILYVHVYMSVDERSINVHVFFGKNRKYPNTCVRDPGDHSSVDFMYCSQYTCTTMYL